MRISNIKYNGFTMIEVLCSISVFLVLFTVSLEIQIDVFKMKKYNKEVSNCIYAVQFIKDNMIYNLTYDDLVNLDSSNMKYVNIDTLMEFDYKSDNILELFSSIKPKDDYIEVNIETGEILKIGLKANENSYGIDRTRECEFYKGNFER